MTTENELRSSLLALAKRSISIMGACSNAESTKLYLALPFLGMLGYDYTNPYEVYPDHISGTSPKGPHRIDFAILRDGNPIIGVECKASGSSLDHGNCRLREFFNASPQTKLGILTNGVIFSFFVDSDRPDVMDSEPYLTLDLELIARAGASDDIVTSLLKVTRAKFDPAMIAEAAHVTLVKRRLHTLFSSEAATPSEAFCRFALGEIGLKNVRKEAVDRYYGPIIKACFEEALVLPIVHKLQLEHGTDAGSGPLSLRHMAQQISTSERELALLTYVRRRLAYLVDNEEHFAAIDSIHAKDYVGRIAVYYGREQKGRLFDFIPGADQADKYIFPEPIGEIVTNAIGEIDSALKVTFVQRVRELKSATEEKLPLSRTA
jgi:hypothetical protein